LQPFFEEIFSYSYNEKPNYSKLVHLLTVQLLDSNIIPNNDIFQNKQIKPFEIDNEDGDEMENIPNEY